MVITLNNKDYSLYFSIAGIDFLDRKYYVEASGVKFGFGVGMVYQQIEMKNVVGIFNAIKACLINKDVKDDVIEDYIVKVAEDDKLEELCEELIDELKKQPLTRKSVADLTKRIEDVQEEQVKQKLTKK